MRNFTKFLIIFASVLFIQAGSATHAHAMDALLGEVVSIDAENRQLTVSVDGSGEHRGARHVVVSYDRRSLPDFVQPGAVVRLWGEFISNDRSVFRIQTLHNGECLHGNDPTGVRSRLKQGRGQHGMGMGKNRGGRCP